MHVMKCANCMRKMTCEGYLSAGIIPEHGGGATSNWGRCRRVFDIEIRRGIQQCRGVRIGSFKVGLPVRNILGRPIHLQLDDRGCFSLIWIAGDVRTVPRIHNMRDGV